MVPKKKVVIVCDKNSRTSFGRLTLDLEHTLFADFDVSILWLKTPKYFPDDDKALPEERGTKSSSIWAKSLHMGFYKFREPFVEYLQKLDPTIVFFIRPELGFLVPVAKKVCPKSKTVVLIHDTFAETLYPFSVKFKLISMFYAKPTAKADGFVYNSRYSKREAEKYYGIAGRPNAVTGLPLNSLYYNQNSDRMLYRSMRKSFREDLGIKSFKAMVLNVSLPEKRKNIATFFDMAKARPDVAFVRIGKVNRYVQMLLEERHLKNVFHFTSLSVTNLREFYRHADLFVQPSFQEGFGLPPLEAIACGTPVVCARTTALAEIFSAVCPTVSPATDVQGYLDVLQSVMDGKYEYNAEKVSELLARYSIKTIADKLSAFFYSILDR